jgi:hypothetical protein
MRSPLTDHWAVRALWLSIGAAFLAAVMISRVYWGYWLWRPSMDTRILEARRYVGLAFFEAARRDAGPLGFVDLTSSTVRDSLQRYRQDEYTAGSRRVLHMLDLQGKVDAIPLKRTVELRTLSDLIQGSGALVKPSPGYEERNTFMRGLAVEAEGHDGRRLLFVGLFRGEVSNDHFPLYELLFEAAPGTDRFQLVSATQWFIDIAGIEGLEWPFMFLGFLPISLVIFLLSLGTYTAVHRSSKPRPDDPNPVSDA